MGLLAILVTTLIIILLLVFSNSTLSPFNSSSTSNPKNIENRAKDAVNAANEKLKIEQNQTKNLDLP
ncbi:hypothetical protein HYS94_00655 [Candidatus Daviesbacteria bacterium]|nr:hypothetical protein [Candidatus Daviesbacteria bacterium]